MHTETSTVPRPGFTKCTDPKCRASFAPHWRELAAGETAELEPPRPRNVWAWEGYDESLLIPSP